MKLSKYIYTLLGVCGMLFVASCSDLIVDEVLETVGSGGVLRNVGESNNLDISSAASTYSIQLEAQDPEGGNQLQEVRVNVGFNDNDDMGTDTTALTAFTVIPASAFTDESPTTHELPVGTFSATLGDLLGHINSTLAQVGPGDAFVIDFEMVLTDGRVFNRGNATGDITRTGRFSFFNGQFRYTATIGDDNTLVVDGLSIADDNGLGVLNDGAVDTVFVTFDRDDAFVTAPTITRTSTTGATDDNIGALTQLEDEEYFFLYTAGASAVDTVSFTISGGSTVAGFVMADADLDDAYIIDNVAPTATVGDVVVSTNAGSVSSVSVTISFSEELDEDTIEVTVSSAVFDDVVVEVDVASGDMSYTVEFSPTVGGTAITDAAFSFDLNTDVDAMMGVGVTDLVGNSVVPDFTVDVF